MIHKIAQYKRELAGFSILAAASASQAAVDVNAVVTEINSAVGPIGLIGGAVLVVLVTAAVYKWVRRAL